MGLANTAALKAAGITRKTPSPPGGTIVRDPRTGEATGVLKDNAMDPMYGAIPPPTRPRTMLPSAGRWSLSLRRA